MDLSLFKTQSPFRDLGLSTPARPFKQIILWSQTRICRCHELFLRFPRSPKTLALWPFPPFFFSAGTAKGCMRLEPVTYAHTGAVGSLKRRVIIRLLAQRGWSYFNLFIAVLEIGSPRRGASNEKRHARKDQLGLSRVEQG